jgi:hypothetical protein
MMQCTRGPPCQTQAPWKVAAFCPSGYSSARAGSASDGHCPETASDLGFSFGVWAVCVFLNLSRNP